MIFVKKDILTKKWKKCWTTEFSLFSVWLFGRIYTETMFKEVGVGHRSVVFLVEKNLATNFRPEEEYESFEKKLAEKMLFEKGFKEKTIKLLARNQKEFEKFFNMEEKEFLTAERFARFLEIHRLNLPYYLGIQLAPNGLENFNVAKREKEVIFKICERARKETEPLYPAMEKFLQKIFKYIGKKENIDKKLLRAVLPEEIMIYIKKGKLPNKKLLEVRYTYSVVVSTKRENSLITGKQARQFIEKISKVETEGVTEIKGAITNKGIVRGKCRLLFSSKDMNKIQKGDIIVTTMTRPEWLPAMKKAGAYVTDTGGMLCHAAIVARELNKPCITDTKIAIKVLKDGDTVEVDANKGVIKILKKK